MKRNIFKSITKKKAEQTAQHSIGSQIMYGEALEMTDYLISPNNLLSIEEQREIFQNQSQINTLPANAGDPQPCPTGCGRILDNPHIVQYPEINPHFVGNYDLILNGTLHKKENMLKNFKDSFKKIYIIDSTDLISNC